MSDNKAETNQRKIFKYSLWILGFLIVSLVLGFFRGSDHETIPDFSEGIPVQGYEEGLANPKDKPMVLYFWATWCTVCKANDPFLKASLAPLEDKGIFFLSWEEGSMELTDLQEFLKEKNITYPVAIASPGILKNFRISGYPTTIFVDRSGTVRFVDAGIMNPLSFWIRVYLLGLF